MSKHEPRQQITLHDPRAYLVDLGNAIPALTG